MAADLGIHADDGAASEENAVVRLDYRLVLEAPQVLCRGSASEAAASRYSRCQRGAHLQRTAALKYACRSS
jgi:hypothetical protein